MCTVTRGFPPVQGRDHVFHFGGIGDIVPSIERPLEYMRANVNGTLAVLEASRHAGVRKFVYAASSSCYGMATELPTTEQAPIRPEYPYALSKYLGESAALHWGQVYRLPVIYSGAVLRVPNVRRQSTAEPALLAPFALLAPHP